MADLTPEQMAKAAWDAITKEADPAVLWTAFSHSFNPVLSIAAAIRVAVEADRCASLPAVPEGWKLVPVEPTASMVVAALRADEWSDDVEDLYRAMVSAAPPAPSAWRPIETAPKTRDDFTGGTVEILGWIPDDTAPKGGNRETVWWEPKLGDGGKGAWWFCGDHEVHPTHWMPLPAPPAPAEEAGK